jgi:stearoyl-CoA desaturase (delta-9 desaturase)
MIYKNHTRDIKGPTHLELLQDERRLTSQVLVYVFVIVPIAALILAIPLAWGQRLDWLDVLLAAFFYTVTLLGITVGFHRYFTHKSFKAGRGMRIALAVAGSMAIQGPILHWVADHRRHHAFADQPGDPHSPWAFGTSPSALLHGIWHAHVGWILNHSLTNQRRFAPDLLADPDIRIVNRMFGPIALMSLLSPALLGALITWSWYGGLTAFFWASLVRVALQQHVTWSVNSICHLVGQRPFTSRDKSTNFWPLAILSFGDSWHNLHHADPTCARHGVQRGQIDISGRMIWMLEKIGLAYDVRWPKPDRLARLRCPLEFPPA